MGNALSKRIGGSRLRPEAHSPAEQAEQQRRLAAQQEEDRQKRIAAEAQQKAEADKKRLEEIRRQRAQAAREAQLAEQKLRQLADARARQAAASANQSQYGQPAAPAGNGGTDADLRGRYAAAIQEAVLRQWTRPESVPVGTRCRVVITQLPGGEVEAAADLPWAKAPEVQGSYLPQVRCVCVLPCGGGTWLVLM